MCSLCAPEQDDTLACYCELEDSLEVSVMNLIFEIDFKKQ